MDIEQEARAEAEKRWPDFATDPHHARAVNLYVQGYIAGASRLASPDTAPDHAPYPVGTVARLLVDNPGGIESEWVAEMGADGHWCVGPDWVEDRADIVQVLAVISASPATRGAVADEISGIVVGSGYESVSIGITAALEAADALLAAFTITERAD